MLNDIKQRKLKLLLLIFVSSTALLLFEFLTSDQWVDLIKWAFSAYVVGNVGEHYTSTTPK